MKKLIGTLIGLMAFLTFCIMPPSASAAGAPYITYNLPQTMKLGDALNALPDPVIHFHNLTPGSGGMLFIGDNSFYSSMNALAIGLNQGGTPPLVTVDGQGNADSEKVGDYFAAFYRPGTITIQPKYAYGNTDDEALAAAQVPVGNPISITIEAPVITTNAPATAAIGTTLNLTTALTNIDLTNRKVSDFAEALAHDTDNTYYPSNQNLVNLLVYHPSIEIVSGNDLITQSNQDFTNTLNTSEVLHFNKAGTVELKVAYRQINTCGMPDPTKRYSPEKTITINVIGSSQSTSSKSSVPSAPNQSHTTSQSPSSSNSSTSSSATSPASASSDVITSSQPIVLTDATYGIKISAENGAIPDGATVVANPITTGEQFDKVKAALVDTAGKFTAFDISLTQDGMKIEPNGKVLVSIPIPSGYDKTKLEIYFVDDEGKITAIPSMVDGDNITFETDHFSNYVVAEKSVAAAGSQSVRNHQSKGGNLMIRIALIILIVLLAGAGAIWFFKFRKMKA
jgi:hypothetical protein